MKKSIFLLAPLSLLAACAMSPGMVAQVALPTCDTLAIPANCSNTQGTGPKNPEVNFNRNGPTLAPRNVCAHKGVTLQFKITPTAPNQNPPGSVAVVPKDGKNTWLVGTNSADNTKIEIKIPGNVPANTSYDYTIVSVENGVVSCVDPRIHVTM